MTTLERHKNWILQKSNNTLKSKTEGFFQLKNPNQMFVTRIKKLKIIRKSEQVNEDVEGKMLKNKEENHRLRNLNQELEEKIKELKEDKKLQVERFEKF